MRYYIDHSALCPDSWRIFKLLPDDFCEYLPGIYRSEEAAEVACALLNLTSE